MKYSNYRSYETVVEKFKNSRKSEKLEDLFGLHNVEDLSSVFYDQEGKKSHELIAYHCWSKEHSCHITCKYKIYY